MDKLQPTLEQLHLAAVQLRESGPSYARFSLVLSDNMIELLAHERILRMVYRYGLLRERKRMDSLAKLQYSAAEVKRATGKFFSDKLNFLAKHQVI